MKMQPISHQPVIATDRFDLRPLRRSDCALIQKHAGDSRVALTTPDIPHPLPVETVPAFIEKAMQEPRDEDVWVMDGTKGANTAVMGVISLKRLDRNQSEIGYWVAPAYWNARLASDAVAALVAANPLDNDAMFGSVFTDNPASAKVLTNCGFVYLGEAETYCLARETCVPTWTYSKKL